MKRTIITCNSGPDKEQNIKECFAQIDANEAAPKLIIFFSDYDDLWYYAKEFRIKYPEITTIGSSSHTFFSSAGYADKGLTAMAIYDGIECSSGLIFEVSRYPNNYKKHIMKAVEKLSNTENTCCLEFISAFTHGEELVLDTFESILGEKNIPVIGATAGNSGGKTTTAVALNGDIYIDTCVFVLIHNLNGKIAYSYENIFKKTNHQFVATDIDCEERRVYEYNNQPAAQILARTLNIPVEQLKDALLSSPMGKIVGDEVFITGTDEVCPDGSITYFSRIYNHTKMVLLEKSDLHYIWTKTAQHILSEIPNPSFCISINCLSRTKLFAKDKQWDSFVSKLTDYYTNYIGVSGYGEQLNSNHLNQSMIMIAFE